jgi:hypothetical protein
MPLLHSSYCYGVTKRERAEDEMSSFKPSRLTSPATFIKARKVQCGLLLSSALFTWYD